MFFTPLGRSLWEEHSDLLKAFYDALLSGDFFGASTIMGTVKNTAEYSRINCASDSSDDVVNDFFLAEIASQTLQKYVQYWNLIRVGRFSDSWCLLQDLQDLLRILFAWSKRPVSKVLEVIGNQCGFLEQVYPYKIFFSVEMIVDEMTCSICGRSTLDNDCSHVPGNLYRGQIAFGIVHKVRELQGFAMVKNPLDKRCVVTIPDAGKQFAALAYLQKHIKTGRFNPLMFEKVDKSVVQQSANVLDGSFRNKFCPCGSKKKFKKCCLPKGSFAQHHLEFVGRSQRMFNVGDLLGRS